MQRSRLEAKAEQDLEWGRLAAAVVARCKGPRARRVHLPLAATEEGTRTALREPAEALALLGCRVPDPFSCPA